MSHLTFIVATNKAGRFQDDLLKMVLDESEIGYTLKHQREEILISGALIILLGLLLNPLGFWMPTTFHMAIVLGLVVVFALFSSFIWRENARDEREGLHKMMAGRIAFFAGTAVLVIGIIVQSFKHELDFWLVLTLGTMIFAKIIGLLYGRIKY